MLLLLLGDEIYGWPARGCAKEDHLRNRQGCPRGHDAGVATSIYQARIMIIFSFNPLKDCKSRGGAHPQSAPIAKIKDTKKKKKGKKCCHRDDEPLVVI